MQLGEPGVALYERRYAALSAVRSQLEKRMNLTELQSKTIFGGAKKWLGFGTKAQLAGASQAAVADLFSIGRALQQGFRELARSGIKAERGVGGIPQRLLPAGARQTPPSINPLGPRQGPPTIFPGTRESRLGKVPFGGPRLLGGP